MSVGPRVVRRRVLFRVESSLEVEEAAVRVLRSFVRFGVALGPRDEFLGR
ncbi:hypothetical protein [Halopelagius longus]|nr:hypothetical protein [Halopelagius longus]